MNIYEKLNEARAKFHGLKIKKTGHNPYSDFDYFELSDFLIPALNIFTEMKLCATVSFNDTLASMTIVNVEKPDETIVFTAPMSSAALKASHAIQNLGACETYHRRYFWILALEIVEHDALDKTLGKDDKMGKPAALVAQAAKTVVDEARQNEIEEMAFACINYWKANNRPRALELAREITNNEEKVIFWDLLSKETALRTFLTANKQTEKTI